MADAQSDGHRFGPVSSDVLFRTILNRIPVAVALSKMPEVSLVFVNDAFVELFGIAREDAIGWTSVDLGINDAASRAAVARQLAETGVVRDYIVHRHTARGDDLVLSLNVDRMTVEGREFVLTTIVDVSGRTSASGASEHASGTTSPE